MKIRHVHIENFRGITSLDWNVVGDLICLVGPCDSGKSTILKAIQYALFPSWNLVLEDFDFRDADTNIPIKIIITVGELPEDLLTESSMGHYVRGWTADNGVVDEPTDGCDFVISIQLTVSQDREPKWSIYNDRLTDEVTISASVRASLLAVLIQQHSDRDLTWSKGSSLSRLTGNLDGSNEIIRELERSFRSSFDQGNHEWDGVCQTVQEEALELGVCPSINFRVGLDTTSRNNTGATLSLFDGNVPLRNYGLGSKILTTLKIQHSNSNIKSILMLDEIEHGLDPHRLRHLIRKIRPQNHTQEGHVIFTTHSPVAIVEAKANEIKVLRNAGGAAQVFDVVDDSRMQRLIRSSPEAFLALKVIVCEGKTEMGFCRALDSHWENANQNMSFATRGIIPVFGDGRTNTGSTATVFRNLGYSTVILADSDQPLDVNEQQLAVLGIPAVIWGGSCFIENRLSMDVPLICLQEMINLVATFEGRSQTSIVDQLRTIDHVELVGFSIQKTIESGVGEQALRTAIGHTANISSWFKDISRGEALGNVVAPHLSSMMGTDTYQKIEALSRILYGTT